MNKVFIMAKAKPFCPESYVGVFSTPEIAERALRKCYPNAKEDGLSIPGHKIFNVKTRDGDWLLFFITESEIDGTSITDTTLR